MNPRPCLLASVHSRVDLLISKNESSGGEVRDFLTWLRASSWEVDHRNSFLVLSNGLNGFRRTARVLVLVLQLIYKASKGSQL